MIVLICIFFTLLFFNVIFAKLLIKAEITEVSAGEVENYLNSFQNVNIALTEIFKNNNKITNLMAKYCILYLVPCSFFSFSLHYCLNEMQAYFLPHAQMAYFADNEFLLLPTVFMSIFAMGGISHATVKKTCKADYKDYIIASLLINQKNPIYQGTPFLRYFFIITAIVNSVLGTLIIGNYTYLDGDNLTHNPFWSLRTTEFNLRTANGIYLADESELINGAAIKGLRLLITFSNGSKWDSWYTPLNRDKDAIRIIANKTSELSNIKIDNLKVFPIEMQPKYFSFQRDFDKKIADTYKLFFDAFSSNSF